MAGPEGKLTPVQHEILNVVWAAGDAGASVTAVWEAVAARRDVTRTTILNLVDRLEKRGWLRRAKGPGAYHYLATVDRQTTERLLAHGFIDEYFGGSPSAMVQSLLGGQRLKPEELRRLRRLLDAGAAEPESKEGPP